MSQTWIDNNHHLLFFSSHLSLCCLEGENSWGIGEGVAAYVALTFYQESCWFLNFSCNLSMSLVIDVDSMYKEQTTAMNFFLISKNMAHLNEICWWQFRESACMRCQSWEVLLFFFFILKGDVLPLGNKKMMSCDFCPSFAVRKACEIVILWCFKKGQDCLSLVNRWETRICPEQLRSDSWIKAHHVFWWWMPWTSCCQWVGAAACSTKPGHWAPFACKKE